MAMKKDEVNKLSIDARWPFRVWSAPQEKENKRKRSANASTMLVRRKKTKAKKRARREQEKTKKNNSWSVEHHFIVHL